MPVSRRNLITLALAAAAIVGVALIWMGSRSSNSATTVTSIVTTPATNAMGQPVNTQSRQRSATTVVEPRTGPAKATTPAPTTLAPTTLASTTPTPTRLPDGCKKPGKHSTIALSALPPEAIDTLGNISDGPPYPFRVDGSVFQNREGILPDHPRGYYHEFTVITPGSSDRGARRIVTGECGELWYTDDHYDSFALIDPNR